MLRLAGGEIVAEAGKQHDDGDYGKLDAEEGFRGVRKERQTRLGLSLALALQEGIGGEREEREEGLAEPCHATTQGRGGA